MGEDRTSVMRTLLTREIEMRSLPFSNRWELLHDGDRLATMVRHPRERRTTVEFRDRTRAELVPRGWGIVEARSGGDIIGEIIRQSWFGRRWDIRSQVFTMDLISRPLPRRWYFAVGGGPVAELAGSLFSYNRLRIHPLVSVPVVAALLGWQVICRPWEAAAHPRPAPEERRVPARPRPAPQASPTPYPEA
jgi:hypothetical protein